MIGAPDCRSWCRRLVDDVWNGEDHAALLDLVRSDYAVTDCAARSPRRGPIALLDLINAYKAFAPDLEMRIEEQRGEGECIETHWTAMGQHCGVAAGVAPTGRPIRLAGTLTARVVRNPVGVAFAGQWDTAAFLAQTGVTEKSFAGALRASVRQVRVRAVDSRDGVPLLLFPTMSLPGWLTWKNLIDVVKVGRPVVTFQLLANRRAFERRNVPQGYQIPVETRAIHRGLSLAGLDGPFDIVGHSAGATIALDFALTYRQRVKSLTLIEPGAAWVLAATDRLHGEALAYVHEQMASQQKAITPSIYAEYIHRLGVLPQGMHPTEVRRWPLYCAYMDTLRFRRALYVHADSLTRLRSAGFPVLLMSGTDSPVFYREVASTLASQLPNVRLLVMPGGHAPHEREGALPFLGHLNRFHSSAGA